MKKIIITTMAVVCVSTAIAQTALNTSSITSYGYASAKQSNYGTFLGSYAGRDISKSANNSCFIGCYAGLLTTTGSNNTFVGRSAGYYNTVGNGNTALGTMSLQNNSTGSYNTSVGFWSGYNAGSGSNNVLLGYMAGYKVGSGSNNVFIGYQAGYNETGSNKLYISNSSTTQPLIYGDFSKKQLTINGALSVNGLLSVQGNITAPGSLSLGGGISVAAIKGSSLELKNGTNVWARINNKTFIIDGTIKAKLVNVVTDVWADDVFDEGYKAPTIGEIESYIAANKHLPGVPSAAEVVENGIDVANMSATLLRKIEELTLIVIEQNKAIESLKKQIGE